MDSALGPPYKNTPKTSVILYKSSINVTTVYAVYMDS